MQQKQENTALVWFRNNVRVRDNIALHKATQHHKKVIAVFFFDPKLFSTDVFGFQKTAKFRANFLIETVKDLEKNLAKLNISLLTYFDSPEIKIQKLCFLQFFEKKLKNTVLFYLRYMLLKCLLKTHFQCVLKYLL